MNRIFKSDNLIQNTLLNSI